MLQRLNMRKGDVKGRRSPLNARVQITRLAGPFPETQWDRSSSERLGLLPINSNPRAPDRRHKTDTFDTLVERRYWPRSMESLDKEIR